MGSIQLVEDSSVFQTFRKKASDSKSLKEGTAIEVCTCIGLARVQDTRKGYARPDREASLLPAAFIGT